MSKKAQSALEFLSTYGWALLVIIIMLGAFTYFGVLNPTRFMGSRCVIDVGLSCDEFVLTRVSDSQISVDVYMTNSLSSVIQITDANLSLAEFGSSNPGSLSAVTLYFDQSTLVLDSFVVQTNDIVPAVGQKISLTGTISYVPSGKNLVKKANIEIFDVLT
jgi:hypothetical protein